MNVESLIGNKLLNAFISEAHNTICSKNVIGVVNTIVCNKVLFPVYECIWGSLGREINLKLNEY
jgi:hypothetical protein